MSEALSALDRISAKNEFHKSAKATKKRKPRGRQSTPRITLRLTEEEMDKLKHLSANMTVSAYIRRCLFEKKETARKVRLRAPVKDQEALAKVLGKLGESRIANNLNEMAYEANCGSLLLDEQTYNQIQEAYEHVCSMRLHLLEALGITGGK